MFCFVLNDICHLIATFFLFVQSMGGYVSLMDCFAVCEQIYCRELVIKLYD